MIYRGSGSCHSILQYSVSTMDVISDEEMARWKEGGATVLVVDGHVFCCFRQPGNEVGTRHHDPAVPCTELNTQDAQALPLIGLPRDALQLLLSQSGQDVTELFLGRPEGGAHSQDAQRLLAEFWVGRLARAGCESSGDDGAGASAAAAPPPPPGPTQSFVPDEAKPLLAQVGRMRSADYEAWVHTPMRGQPRFFESGSLESITKVKW